MIGRHLDTGIQGVQIPMVNSAAEASAAVRAAKYQPLGNRGLAAARAANYGQVLPFSYREYIETSNAETMVIVQVETPASIKELPEIVQVPGIDIVFIVLPTSRIRSDTQAISIIRTYRQPLITSLRSSGNPTRYWVCSRPP